MIKIRNTTGLSHDTKVILGIQNVTEALGLKSITLNIDAGGLVTANLLCEVEECDLSVLPENVKVGLEAKVGLDLDADDMMQRIKTYVAGLDDEEIAALRAMCNR